MADKERMYRLDTDGNLNIYKSASFDAPNAIVGRVFAGINVHSLWSDGTHYYLHLKETSGRYQKNDVVKFSSVSNLISGDDGTVINQAAPGSAAFMADGKSFYKINQGEASPALLRSQDLNQVVINSEFATEGNLFCGKRHAGIFSDGKQYYLHVAEDTKE